MDHDSIEVSDAGAERLARLAEGLTDDQVDALLGAAEAREDGSISRREFAKAAGALGLGGLVGGGGAAAMTGTAKADASTSDSDGNVGGPNDRVDVFADGVDATTVSPNELSGGLTSGSTIDTLDGLGLEFVNNTLKTTGTPGAVAEIENDELSGTVFDAKKLIFRDEFFLTYQSFVDKVEIGLDDVVYDRSSNTIGDGTPDGDFSSVSTTNTLTDPSGSNHNNLVPLSIGPDNSYDSYSHTDQDQAPGWSTIWNPSTTVGVFGGVIERANDDARDVGAYRYNFSDGSSETIGPVNDGQWSKSVYLIPAHKVDSIDVYNIAGGSRRFGIDVRYVSQ